MHSVGFIGWGSILVLLNGNVYSSPLGMLDFRHLVGDASRAGKWDAISFLEISKLDLLIVGHNNEPCIVVPPS